MSDLKDVPQEPAGTLIIANPAAEATLVASIQRALDVVEAESQALRSGAAPDLRTFEYRKSQALLDLSRARQAIPANALGQDIRDMLGRLRGELTDNMNLLSRHLSAVKEIADLLAQSLLDADSDGTYDRPVPEFCHD